MIRYFAKKDFQGMSGINVSKDEELFEKNEWLCNKQGKIITGNGSYFANNNIRKEETTMNENAVKYAKTPLVAKSTPVSKDKPNTLFPSDVETVYVNGKNVTVVLRNGKRATAECSEQDEFDPFVGFTLAYFKAHNSKNFVIKKALTGAIENAKNKGYKQTIIKNR